MKIKAISLKQPWANMIVEGKKTIETRKWSTTYRGDILICSSKKPDIVPAGCALAIVQIVDCRPMTMRDSEAACCPPYHGAWSWILENIRPIDPFPVKGMLGIFELDIDPALLSHNKLPVALSEPMQPFLPLTPD